MCNQTAKELERTLDRLLTEYRAAVIAGNKQWAEEIDAQMNEIHYQIDDAYEQEAQEGN